MKICKKAAYFFETVSFIQILKEIDLVQFSAGTLKGYSSRLCKMCAVQETCGSWRAPGREKATTVLLL